MSPRGKKPYTSLPPMLGWQWQMSNGGAASTRGISLGLTLKRATEAREIFPGQMKADGSYKAIFENMSDLNLCQQHIQGPAVSTLTQPLPFGGASFGLTMFSIRVLQGGPRPVWRVCGGLVLLSAARSSARYTSPIPPPPSR